MNEIINIDKMFWKIQSANVRLVVIGCAPHKFIKVFSICILYKIYV